MKNCKQCSHNFSVTDEDRTFYNKISPKFDDKTYSIPEPSLCPDCRQQRRLTFRNERTLYNRNDDLTGKQIVSLYSSDKPNKVYNTHDWWSDKWDPKDHGRDFDFGRPFFEQFQELMTDVPEIALMNDDGKGSENCAFTNDFAYSKNCYLCFVTWYNEDCYYSTGIHHSKDTVDSLDTMKSELIYECIDCNNCYNSVFLKYCNDCTDCYFGYDLKNCKNCFKCASLKNKQYHIENKPYSKEEYDKIINKEFFKSYKKFEQAKADFFKFLKKTPQRNVYNINCENCLGNKLHNCKKVVGFESYECEDSKYIYHCPPVKDCYDITNTGRAELCYETLVSNDGYRSLFTNECWNTNNSMYCNHCFNCDYIFGCSGLKKHKYCIFNKQYTKEEYNQLVPKIIKHMETTGEWGEFFPISISPFAYNETTAQDYFPLTQNQAQSKNYKWKDKDPKEYRPQDYNIPDNIDDIPETIIDEVLACSQCGKNFKIIAQELKFYKKLDLPIPQKCPDCRHLSRMGLRNPRRLWKKECNKCQEEMYATYPTNSDDIVYCEKCYTSFTL